VAETRILIIYFRLLTVVTKPKWEKNSLSLHSHSHV